MLVATVHVLFAVPMYLYVFTVNVESWLGVRHNTEPDDSSDNPVMRRMQQRPVITRIVVRVAEVCFCALVAILIPYFSDVMTLIGTIAGESLTFVLPCMFWMRLSWKDGQTWELVLCAFIAIIGTFCAAFGTVDAVKEFLHDIRQ